MANKLLSNIRNYIQGTYYNFLNGHELTPTHIKEQAFYRASLCEDCLKQGSCPHCGCSTPALFFSPLKEDALKKWGPMVSKEEWEKSSSQEASLDAIITPPTQVETLTWLGGLLDSPVASIIELEKEMNFDDRSN